MRLNNMLKPLLYFLLFASFLDARVDYQEYCSKDSLRETNVLIDMHKIDDKLYGQVIKELDYTPNEKVNIYAFRGSHNTLGLIYEYCYPKYTQKKIDSIKQDSSKFRMSANKFELMEEHQMFFQSKLTQKLTSIRLKFKNTHSGDFENALRGFLDRANKYGRIFIFTTRDLNKNVNLDFKKNKVFIFNKKVVSKRKNEMYRNFFVNNNASFQGVFSRYPSATEYKNRLKYLEKDFNLLISGQKIKASIGGYISQDGNLENMWLQMHGILNAPLSGSVDFKSEKNFSLKAEIPYNIVVRNNKLLKGDKLQLNVSDDRASGKFYNHAFMFTGTSKYFEYRIVK